MLIMSWFDDPHFGTRDLDLLGFGDLGTGPAKARGEYFPSASVDFRISRSSV